jgi:hypothetical protein
MFREGLFFYLYSLNFFIRKIINTVNLRKKYNQKTVVVTTRTSNCMQTKAERMCSSFNSTLLTLDLHTFLVVGQESVTMREEENLASALPLRYP